MADNSVGSISLDLVIRNKIGEQLEKLRTTAAKPVESIGKSLENTVEKSLERTGKSALKSIGDAMENCIEPIKESFNKAAEEFDNGTLTDISGVSADITESLTDRISIESQCVENADIINFGGMYIGALECVLKLDSRKKDELIDGKISIDCGVELADGTTEWVPMGVWNITECTLENSGRLKIRAMDNMKLLLTDTEEEKRSFVGVVRVANMMQHVADLTGVSFAQTIEELRQLTSWQLDIDIFAIRYGKNAWEEVKSIAQLLGCFAFANREGKIEFRRLDNTNSAVTVPAEKRHSMRLKEYTCAVKSIEYTCDDGHKVSYKVGDTGVVFDFASNLFLLGGASSDLFYQTALERIAANIGSISYTPGETAIYGNPVLDVGDYIQLSGGTIGEETARFLICGNTWQFRGPQTLTAGGISETGSSSGSGGSSSAASAAIRNITLTKPVEYVALDDYPGELTTQLRTIAYCGFSCRSSTNCFLECNLQIAEAAQACIVDVRIYVDEVLQTLSPKVSVSSNGFAAVHFSLSLAPSEGRHTLSIAASGSGNASSEAYIWGQNLAPEQPDATDSSDYLYTISSGTARIDKYIGSGMHPLIPSRLGGAKVITIGRKAFIESELISAVIPEGITEIQ